MIGGDVLLVMGIALAASALLVLAAWLTHAAWQTRSARRFAAERPAVLRAVAEALGRRSAADAELALLELTTDRRIDVLVDMAFTVSGEQRAELNRIAERTGVLSRAARWAYSPLWSHRLWAARLLSLFGDGSEQEGLRLLDDRRPEVRAQAAEWAAENPSQNTVRALIKRLDDVDPGVRFAARDGLRRAGRGAVAALAEHLCNADGVGAAQGLEAAQGVATPDLLAPAMRFLHDDDPTIRARAAALAGAAGGPQAADALAGLLGDASPEVRAAAARGLGALGRWREAGPLTQLLDDDSFAVRRAAALALLRLGPTGELMLKRAARGGDGRVREIALNALAAEPQASASPPADAAPRPLEEAVA